MSPVFILHIATVHHGTWALSHPLSSEAERRTHNPEVGGSKPPGGILPFANFLEFSSHIFKRL